VEAGASVEFEPEIHLPFAIDRNRELAVATRGGKEVEETENRGATAGGRGDATGERTVTSSGAPLKPVELPMDLIDEDPLQPRAQDSPGFSPQSIAEIGATIKERGVKSPISVRRNRSSPGRYIINHGARRFRGSKWAGKTTIPAFVDDDYNAVDQVIENLHRNELTPREIADFIGRELAKGKKRTDIAFELGKSPAFITQHAHLLDLPGPIALVFNSGRVRDVTVISELLIAHKKRPREVQLWLQDEEQEISRGSVRLLREFLEDKARAQDAKASTDDDQGALMDEAGERGADMFIGADSALVASVGLARLRRASVQVRHEGRLARIVLKRRPTKPGRAYFKYEDDGSEVEASLSEATLVAIVED
jgi:ParB family chromosome partitioning protein